jgi:thiol-disulfide isomerase/thioredoxin
MILLLWAMGFAGCVKDDETPTEEYVGIGDPLPAFAVSGNLTNYHSEQSIGKITLITFFDPECSDCRRERPLLQRVWKEMQAEEVFEMVNIARGRTLENLAEAEGGESWLAMPCYPDPDRSIYNLFATSTIPRIYLVDREGKVREKWVEKTGKTEDEFLAVVKSHAENP